MKEVRMRIWALILFTVFQCQVNAQDVWLQNYFSPLSGCTLTNAELVNVLINNNSGAFIPANTITVSYTINGGPPVSQLLPVNLFPGASWNFTFNTPANLSACMSYNMNVTATYAPDPNLLNNQLNWVVVNDCVIVPGAVQFSTAECAGSNSGVLNLAGWTNGSITNWESSINGGASWTSIPNVTTSQFYSNLITTTLYRVQFNGGFCPNDSSGFATITVNTPPVPGTINSSATHCESSATGVLDLVGSVGPINFWEYSENSGASWTNIANPTTSQPYTGLTTDRWYRVQIEGGGCPDVFSDTAIITVDDLTVGGSLGPDQTVCEQSTVSLALIGNNGVIQDWEYSEDLIVWNPIGVVIGTYDTPPLTQTTYYRVEVTNGVCPSTYSDTVTITVETNPVGGTINSSATHCESSATGVLDLVGVSGAINFWEYSENSGGIWTNIANSTSSEPYTGLTTDRWYRVQVEGGQCPDVFSDTAIITVDDLTVGGTLGADQVVCEQSTVSLALIGNNGVIQDWEYSEDLIVWNPIGVVIGTYDTPPLTQTTYYRVEVTNGVCPSTYSDTVMITVETNPVGGTVNGSMQWCTAVTSDTLILTGYTGSISSWQQSTDNGVSWGAAAGSNDSLIYSGLISTTWYRVFLDGGSCPDAYSDTAIISIYQGSYAGILMADATICIGETVNLSTVTNVGTTIVWESSVDLVIWNSFANNVTTQTVSPATTTSYRIIVQNMACPEDTSNIVLVTVNPLPAVSAGPDVTITESDTVQLNGTMETIVVWSPASGLSNSAITDPLAWPASTTTYTYTVTNDAGCQNSDDVTITVEPLIDPSINIRNVVTGNGDGYNDFWMITGIENYPETEVTVFNIYGQLVYRNEDYKNDWAGTYKDEKLPNGTYYYCVKLKDDKNLIKGNLTILGNE